MPSYGGVDEEASNGTLLQSATSVPFATTTTDHRTKNGNTGSSMYGAASSSSSRHRTGLVVGVLIAVALIGTVITWSERRLLKPPPPVTPWPPGSPPAPTPEEQAALKGPDAQWVPFPARAHPDSPTDIWGATRRPYPTGAWWTNLVVGGPSSQGVGIGAAMMTPYAVKVVPELGVALSYGALSATNESLTISASTDLGVTLAGGVAKRYVLQHDDLTMTMRLEGKKRGGTVDALFARGSPYMTFRFGGAKIAVHSDFEFASVTAQSSTATDGDAAEDDAANFFGGELGGWEPAFAAKEASPTKDDDVTTTEDEDEGEEEQDTSSCSARPSCVSAGMSGACCPMDAAHGHVVHPCCSGALKRQGPAHVFEIATKNGYKWRLYTSSATTFEWDVKSGAVTTEDFWGVARVALVPDQSGLSSTASLAEREKKINGTVPDAVLLDAHAEAYPTSGSVRVTADRSRDFDVGSIEFEWRVAYMASTSRLAYEARAPSLLMLALPHHVDTLVVTSDSVGFVQKGCLEYRGGLKGPTTPVLASKWVMRENLPRIAWRPPRAVKDPSKVKVLQERLREDVKRAPGETDANASWIAQDSWFGNAYWNGKELGRLASLALIAEGLRDDESKSHAISQLRAILEMWLEGRNRDYFVYDATYGGLCTVIGVYDHDADFGNGFYNDHHFHYGYFLYAAAVAVKEDAGFAAKYRDQLFAILYDVANPGSGASLYEPGIDRAAFPRARHKDFYDGHSWASGIFFMGQGKAQESSSEAVNAYYGAYLLSLAFGDVELVDWSRVLLALEIRAAQTYYHMPAGTPVYPKAFAASNRVVGVLGALSTGADTWFGPSTAFSHGIQILPVTPISESLLAPITFIEEDIHFLDHHLDRDSCDDAWLAFLECERAVVDPDAAWHAISNLSAVDQGTTFTSLLYWVATRPDPSEILPKALW